MNAKTARTPQPVKRDSQKPAVHESASAKATKIARKGEPLTPEGPKDRSPKQENL